MLRADLCEQFAVHWLSLLGLKTQRTWNLHSLFTMLSLLYSLIIWSYSYLRSGGSTESLHRIFLALLALGLFSAKAFNHGEVLRLARELDGSFLYTSSGLRDAYTAFRLELFNSTMRIYADVFTIMVYLVWTSIQYQVFKECVWNSETIRPPLGMILPYETAGINLFHHFMDTAFVVNACHADVIVLHLFMMFSFCLTANFKVLCRALAQEAPTDQHSLSASLDVCIRHHQILFKAFSSLRNFFDKTFYVIYFSMMSAIAMCRTLLTNGELNIEGLLPLYYLEVGYIHMFCYCADIISHESEQVRFGAYATEWYRFSQSFCQSIRIMTLRASKPPKMYFYLGGSDISCATFTIIVNASLTYFVVTILLDRQF